MPDEHGLSSHIDYTFGFDYADRLTEIFQRAETRHTALIQIIEAAFNRRFEVALEAHGEGDAPDGSYSYIALSVDGFIDAVMELRELMLKDPHRVDDSGALRPVSYLEPGCGPGRNLELIRSSGLFEISQAAGFDIMPEYIALGRELFGLGECLTVDDAMTYDYGGWDVIFTYRPFSDDDAEAAYERRIAETADPGAYIICPLRMGIDELPQIEVLDYGGQIMRKRR